MHGKQRRADQSPLPVLTLPQACPPALGAFYRGMRVATAGLLGLCPRATATNAAAAPQGMCTAPQSGHNKVSSLYVAARRGIRRVANKVSSFYGTQADPGEEFGQLGDVPDLVAGEEVRRRAERRDHGLLRRNRDGVATMFEMFGKLAVGLSSSPVMAWNRSRSSISRP